MINSRDLKQGLQTERMWPIELHTQRAKHLDNDLELIYTHKMQHADVKKSP